MLIRSLLLLGAGVWSFLFVSAALALATSPLAQLVALVVGVAPVLLLFQLGRPAPRPEQAAPVSSSSRAQEREVVQALEACGELTATTAALRTSLTVDEAAAMLDALAGRGHLQVLVRDGVLVYALPADRRRAEPEQPVAASRPAVSPHGVAHDRPVVDAAPLIEPLSDREREVLTLINAGRSNKEIARDLVVSVGTVKTHTNNIYRKLGARSRTEALARAREHGVL